MTKLCFTSDGKEDAVGEMDYLKEEDATKDNSIKEDHVEEDDME